MILCLLSYVPNNFMHVSPFYRLEMKQYSPSTKGPGNHKKASVFGGELRDIRAHHRLVFSRKDLSREMI